MTGAKPHLVRMRYHVLASDYDGTLAEHGVVDAPTLDALRRLRTSGRRLVMVTGRQLDDLEQVFPAVDLFDLIVAENGAVLHSPSEHTTLGLCPPPPAEFLAELARRGVSPLSSGMAIVATCEPHESTVLQVIHQLGLELQVTFNKGAVMVLPSGVNKATGLVAALRELGLSAHNTVAVGDAENDHAFLDMAELAVAVENALPSLKREADLVTAAPAGAGVTELIDRLLLDECVSLEPRPRRHGVLLGHDRNGGLLPPVTERRRHVRKYTTGELAEDRSFFFRGPDNRLNLRAQNLNLFLQIADGLDDSTWMWHLRRGDYRRWFEEAIKDSELAHAAQGAEALDPGSSRHAIRSAIEQRYTASP